MLLSSILFKKKKKKKELAKKKKGEGKEKVTHTHTHTCKIHRMFRNKLVRIPTVFSYFLLFHNRKPVN